MRRKKLRKDRQMVQMILSFCLFLFILIVIVPTMITRVDWKDMRESWHKDGSLQTMKERDIANVDSLNQSVRIQSNSIVPDKNIVVSGNTSTVLVYREASQMVDEIPLEEYVAGVVAGEMPADFEFEALKAQSVAARTYIMARKAKYDNGGNLYHSGAYVCDTYHCQAYLDEGQLASLKTEEWMKDSWPKIKAAVNETNGQLMYYQGDLVTQPLFHSSSGGRTENSEDVFVSAVPYLRSVDSPHEEDSPYRHQSTSFTLEEATGIMKSKYNEELKSSLSSDKILIKARTDGNAVALMDFAGVSLTGRQVRELFKLRSSDFEVAVDNDHITFITEGYGHGVGMSQYGANGMAKAGYKYNEILSHYYSGVTVM